MIVTTATVLTRARLGTYFVPEMDYDDVADVGVTLGVIAVSALLALLLKPEVVWREVTAARSLRPSRMLLVAVSVTALCWPLASSPELGVQQCALGLGLYGLSCVVSIVSARWVAVPQVLVLLVSMIPKLLPSLWSPFTPSQRGAAFLVVACLVGVVGSAVVVLKTDPRPPDSAHRG